MPKLREENKSLKKENAGLKREKSDLKASVNGTVQQLQSQMMNAVKLAVEKTSSLQAQLQARTSRVEELERQLARLQSTSEVTSDE